MKMKITKRLLEQTKLKEKPYEINDAELKGFTLRIQPTGHMSYYVRFRDQSNKQNRLKLGTSSTLTPVQARDMAKKVLAEIAQGEDPLKSKRKRNNRTLRDFIDNEYAPWARSTQKSGDTTVKNLKTFFIDMLDKPLNEINLWHIEKWIHQQNKRGLKGVTINRYIAYLRSALSKAVELGIIEEHPLKNLKKIDTEEEEIIRYLESDELERLLKALDHREEKIRIKRISANQWRKQRGYKLQKNLYDDVFADHLKAMVVISMNTGLRRGELLQMKWGDVNFNTKILTVVAGNAKSKKARHIPLNNTAYQVLRDWKRQSGKIDGLIFSNNGKCFTNVNRAWKGVLKDSDIIDFRWHDLRHHFASSLVMGGVDIYTVKDLLGHSEVKITEKYAHLAPDHKSAAVAVLDEPSNLVEFNKEYANSDH